MTVAIVILLVCWLVVVHALQPGDRVSTLTQTLHKDLKTEWTDMPLHLMPRFGIPESHIYHVSLPKQSQNSSDFKVNPSHDLKVSFTFMGNKLSVPWTSIYNAKDKVSLKRLIITFTRDEFEVVRLKHRVVCKLLLFLFTVMK